MKKTVNHILAAGLLALLSLASCTDEFIEGNDLQGVDRDKRVEVRLPFGVGRGITTTITTRLSRSTPCKSFPSMNSSVQDASDRSANSPAARI